MSHLVQKTLSTKGTFKGTSSGDVIVISGDKGAVQLIHTRDQEGKVLTASMKTGELDAEGKPVYFDYPLDGALPGPPPAVWYLEDHPLVKELAASMEEVVKARDVLIAKCKGDPVATAAIVTLINTYGF